MKVLKAEDLGIEIKKKREHRSKYPWWKIGVGETFEMFATEHSCRCMVSQKNSLSEKKFQIDVVNGRIYATRVK